MKDLRWFLFRRKQAESERLPPTQAALREAIMLVHYQTIVCASDMVPNPDLHSALDYGWTMEQGDYLCISISFVPIMPIISIL